MLFGNFWIAACALGLTWQTNLLYGQTLLFWPLGSFVFFATLFLYAIHRLVGMKKVAPFHEKYRYEIINQYRTHIRWYAGLGGVGALVSFCYLSRANQLLLVVPGLLSLGYVLPVLNGRRRLRDLNYLKIFLIAIVWAVVTVVMPLLETGVSWQPAYGWTFLERTLFMFAITLPFDIRDLKIDAFLEVRTIPARLGISTTKRLAYTALFLTSFLVIINGWSGSYTFAQSAAIVASCLLTAPLIHRSDRTTSDYFFTGLLDGTMLLQFVLVGTATFV